MPSFRRRYVPGGTFFFTQVTDGRAAFLCEPLARRVLREVLDECRQHWPFALIAIVLLPDHFHAMWELPPEDDNYSRRWAWLKKEFSKRSVAAGGSEQPITPGRARDGRCDVWQPKF